MILYVVRCQDLVLLTCEVDMRNIIKNIVLFMAMLGNFKVELKKIENV